MYRAKQEIVPGSGEGRAIDGGCTAGTILEEDHPIVRQLPVASLPSEGFSPGYGM
jgi:hypothetical protein